MVERQIVALVVVGSSPIVHPIVNLGVDNLKSIMYNVCP